MSLWSEIGEQPAVLERIIADNGPTIRDVGRRLRSSDFTHVVIAGRGTSDNAARFAQYLWGSRNGLSVALAAPSLFTVYARPPRLDGALVIGISQSGQSPDLCAVLAEARRQDRPTLALTNDPGSPLARTAETVLNLGAGRETAVAATKTYTAELLALVLLSLALDPDPLMEQAVERLPAAVATILGRSEEIGAVATRLVDADRAAVLGRGYNHATAFEWALKLQELTYILAQPFSTADFRHGPMAMVQPGFPVLVVDPAGPTQVDTRDLVGRLTDRGAEVTVVTDSGARIAGTHAIELEEGMPEWLTPVTAIVAAQLFTHRLAVERGLDPDAPRGLSKITRTR